MVVALLGVWKAGGCYVPLDPEYPEEYKALLISDSGSRVVVTSEAMDLVEVLGVRRVDIEEVESGEVCDASIGIGIGNEAMAYVLYMSGASGQPQGVMVPHRAIVQSAITLSRTKL